MGVDAGLYMYDVVVKKVHVRYLISRWVLVFAFAILRILLLFSRSKLSICTFKFFSKHY